MKEVNDDSLQEILEACKHFVVDYKKKNVRQGVLNFITHILSPGLFPKNLDLVFDSLKISAKLNVAFGFVLRNMKDGICHYYHAYKENQ